MIPSVLVVSPPHRCDPQLAIAGARAGACGILDLGFCAHDRVRACSLEKLLRFVGSSHHWGVRWDMLGSVRRTPNKLRGLAKRQWPLLLVAGLDFDRQDPGEILALARSVASRVFVEVYSSGEALAAEQSGFDGVVLAGHESGGRVSRQSAYVLLQQLCGKLRIPYWVRGGIGPQTAAAALFAGAAGVVLGEQLWLADESPFSPAEREQLGQLDGNQTVCIGNDRLMYRFSAGSGRAALGALEREAATGGDWPETLRRRLLSPDTAAGEALVPLGQEIAFAAGLARSHGTVGGIIGAFRTAVERDLLLAKEQRALAPGAEFAKQHGMKYPILQGPMARVSDVAGFCQNVAENGALPFLALAPLRQSSVERLLAQTADKLGEAPWGVGLLGSGPAKLRKEQHEVIRRILPSCAIITGGRPPQARELEELGISTYLHVPSRRLLRTFIGEGARKFIFEGRECGGHVGPLTSFALWQSAVEVLLDADIADPENMQIVFAGGVHDALSAAMVSVIAAPLVARGMKIGLLMGTAYLFTPEAVESRAITEEYQRQAIACRETALLVSGAGDATRSVVTPFVEEFNAKKRQLILAGRTPDEIEFELEMFHVGRLRIASKGIARNPNGRAAPGKGEPVAVDQLQQRREGMYVIGDAATMRQHVIPMAELHEAVSRGSLKLLGKPPARKPAWHRKDPRRGPKEPLAIVGIGCMFPESPDVRKYWQNIVNSFDPVREVSPDRWRAEDFYDPDRFKPDHVYSKWGAFLGEIVFDPLQYRMPPATLQSIEPIQLMALEVARQALEDANYQRPGFPKRRTSVIFAVAGTHDHGMGYSLRTSLRQWLPEVENLDDQTRRQILEDLESKLPEWTEDSFAGFLLNVVAGRIANRFDLTGSNYTVDAACASSLAALQTAAEQLRSGTCDAALVGAVDGTNNPFCFMSFAKTHAMSPHGRSRPFDEKADGIGLGEGIAALVIKRLADAERDGDKIYAVVRGIGSSSDGRNRSMTAPFPDGQVIALERAYEDAGVSPATVSLIESHSTGTAIGDQVEIEALTQLFSAEGAPPRGCAIGSVKSMIGHTKAAAGLASLVKTVLAIEHKILPPTIGVETPNELLRAEDCPFYICAEPRPWIDGNGSGLRRAGVSAFGFGGTNFHVVLEEYNGNYHTGSRVDLTPRSAEVFSFCRDRREDIIKRLAALEKELSSTETDELAQLAYSVHIDEKGRQATENPKCRLSIVATSVDDLRKKVQLALGEIADKEELVSPAGIYYSQAAPIETKQICYMFPGQGSQSVNMLRNLVLFSPWAHDSFEEADRLLAEFFEKPLSCYIYPVPAFTDRQRRRQQKELDDTRLAQPALGVTSLFACDMLSRFGVKPGMVAGHSYGEYVALCVAGTHSREDLLKLSALRGRAVHEVGKSNPGAMAAVYGNAEATAAALEELNIDLTLANLNADVQTVVAGSVEAIDAAVVQLTRKGLRTKKIPVTAAFHTSAMDEAKRMMAPHLAETAIYKPRLPVYSNTTAAPYPADPARIRQQLGEHFTQPVLFKKQIQAMYQSGARVFIEVGPGRLLTALLRRNLEGKDHVVLSLDVAGRDGWQQLGHTLARLTVLGLPVDLEPWFVGRRLSYYTVGQFFCEARAKSERKPTDWIVSPARARPVASPTKKPVKKSTHKSKTASPRSGAASPPSGDTQLVVLKKTSETTRTNQPTMEPTPMEREQHAPETTTVALSRADATNGASPMAQFQTTMAGWLEVQKEQQRVSQRFLETQEAVMLGWLQGAAGLPPARPSPRLSAPLRQVSAPAGGSLSVPPTPVLPIERPGNTPPAQAAAVSQPAAPPAAVPPPAPTPLAPTPAAEAPGQTVVEVPAEETATVSADSGTSDGPSPVEQFRKDLIQVISDRTGYPVEMLDENLELEAELGIDSIKTIEIFSSLSTDHAYSLGANGDQEENLAAFAQLTTIRDIISAYEASISKQQQVDRPEQVPVGATPVERVTLKAVKAPHETSDGEKKNSLETTSY